MSKDLAVARLASAWLLYYPDEELLAKLDLIADAVESLPEKMRDPLELFLAHLYSRRSTALRRHLRYETEGMPIP
jgi:nitrate reductase assembly molybdenum cofactor insertion protein NarJ